MKKKRRSDVKLFNIHVISVGEVIFTYVSYLCQIPNQHVSPTSGNSFQYLGLFSEADELTSGECLNQQDGFKINMSEEESGWLLV